MESFLKRRWSVSLIGMFFLGAFATWTGQKLWHHFRPSPVHAEAKLEDHGSMTLADLWEREFFKPPHDPFKEMERMQNEILKNLGPDMAPSNGFDNELWPRFGAGIARDFKVREDEQFVIYEIGTGKTNPQDVEVEVRDGQVTIKAETKGETRKEENTESATTSYSASFIRSFPAPENVEADKFKVEQDGNRIILKFPKAS